MADASRLGIAPANDTGEEGIGAEDVVALSAMTGARMARYRHTELPTIYADPGTTPLECDITNAKEFQFDLETPKNERKRGR